MRPLSTILTKSAVPALAAVSAIALTAGPASAAAHRPSLSTIRAALQRRAAVEHAGVKHASLSDCQPGSALVALVDSTRTGTLTLPAGACWTLTSTATLQALSNLTINGNGDTIQEPVAGPAAWSPMLQLYQDTNLTIDNLNLVGPGAVGNEYTEGRYGIVAESDHGLTLDAVNMQAIGGDFFALMPPNVHEQQMRLAPGGASTDVTVSNSTWMGSAYHGVTIEAVDGATFSGDTIGDVPVDAIDMEYDGGYTAKDPLSGPGWPQDNVTFTGDSFPNDSEALLNVANTGSTTVNGLTFSDNQLSGGTYASLDIAGVRGGHPVTGLTISGNTDTTATQGPNPQDTIFLSNVQGAAITGNNLPWYWYTQPAKTAHLYKVPVNVQQSSSVRVMNNVFVGAQQPVSGSVSQVCGNVYGVSAWQAHQVAQPACS